MGAEPSSIRLEEDEAQKDTIDIVELAKGVFKVSTTDEDGIDRGYLLIDISTGLGAFSWLISRRIDALRNLVWMPDEEKIDMYRTKLSWPTSRKASDSETHEESGNRYICASNIMLEIYGFISQMLSGSNPSDLVLYEISSKIIKDVSKQAQESSLEIKGSDFDLLKENIKQFEEKKTVVERDFVAYLTAQVNAEMEEMEDANGDSYDEDTNKTQ